MIRQARTYLVGAMSGATLIALAIAAFVVLVTAQVFTDWPVGALGDGGGEAAVSAAKPAGGEGTATEAAARGAGTASPTGARKAGPGGGENASQGGRAGATPAIASAGNSTGGNP